MERNWPVEPGDYSIGDPNSEIAISTLSDDELYKALREKLSKNKYAILGVTKTPNIGVEKLVRNIVSNPNIRCLVLVGEDRYSPPVSAVILALHEYGVNGEKRVLGLPKKIFARNLTTNEIQVFRSRVKILDAAWVRDSDKAALIIEKASTTCLRGRRYEGYETGEIKLNFRMVEAEEDNNVVLDKKGFFIIHIDRDRRRIICEHYDNTGRKTTEIIGTSASAIYKTAIKLGLVSRLDHAAYLGKELARAECALVHETRYEQDKA